MELKLNKNIQMYRKDKKLTQEQLAEAMGVTIGAVSKWENGVSNPDLHLVIELADFFEVSVDVLLGYQWDKRHMGISATRIKTLRTEKKYKEANQEANKALTKYPNSFDVTYQSARLYSSIGLEKKEEQSLLLALKLLEHSLELIDQNKDEKTCAEGIHIEIATVQGYLGRVEEAIERLKKHNPRGINDTLIGSFYLQLHKHKESEPYFAEAMEESITNLFRSYVGMANCYLEREEFEQLMACSEWMKAVITPLMEENISGYNAKFLMIIHALDAIGSYAIQEETRAKRSLSLALTYSKRVDEDTDFMLHNRFIPPTNNACVDDIGDSTVFFALLIEECKEISGLGEQFGVFFECVKEEVTKSYA